MEFVHILVKRTFHEYRVNFCTKVILGKLKYEDYKDRTAFLFLNTNNQNYRISSVVHYTSIHMA